MKKQESGVRSQESEEGERGRNKEKGERGRNKEKEEGIFYLFFLSSSFLLTPDS
jgi:hypothetical protein